MIRWLLGALIALLIGTVLVVAAADAIWPPDRMPMAIDDGGQAYAALFKPKAKPIIIRPAPKPPAAPKHHRLKTSMDPFRRFEFDQRTIV